MANTFELISSVTVGAGGAASIDFTSIPSTYTDLQVLFSLRTSDASLASDINIKFNNTDVGNIRYLGGSGSGSGFSGTATGNGASANAATSTGSIFSNGNIYIPNYAGSNYKSFSGDRVTETNGTTIYMTMIAGLWASASAINQLTLFGNFVQYSTAYLYGVKNV